MPAEPVGPGGRDIVARIRQFNQGRRPDLLAIKYAKLRKNAFSFFRGTCHLFYEAWSPPAWLDTAPLATVCGDLHLENFGVYQGDSGLACFDVNDFDEAALAPVTWDLARFVAGLYIALAVIGQRRHTAEDLARQFLEVYSTTLAASPSGPPDAAAADGPIGRMLREFPRYPSPGYHDDLASLTVRGRRLRAGHVKLLPAGDDERRRIANFVEGLGLKPASAGEYRVLDVARLVAGTSSLGLDRYAVLLDGADAAVMGRLLEVKAVRGTCLTPYLKHPQPAWPTQAARVVVAQRRWQSVPPGRLWQAGDAGQSFIVRPLSRDGERVNLTDSGWTAHHLAHLVGGVAAVVAAGHARGAPDAAALPAFARAAAQRGSLIHYAKDCARQVQADYRVYCAAYDRGELAPAS